jgi:hypothetical protein
MQNLGQQIMKASNNFSAQQDGPEEQAIAGIGNALVNKFNQPKPVSTTPNLFGGPTPTFTPPITSPMLSGNPFAPGTPMPMFKPISSTPVQLNPGISMPMFNSGSTGLQMHQPITSPMFNPGSTGLQLNQPITSPMNGPTGLQMNQPITSPMTSGAPNLFGR